MILTIEAVVLCLAFTLMVYLMSRKPIKSLYNYPPDIQARDQRWWYAYWTD